MTFTFSPPRLFVYLHSKSKSRRTLLLDIYVDLNTSPMMKEKAYHWCIMSFTLHMCTKALLFCFLVETESALGFRSCSWLVLCPLGIESLLGLWPHLLRQSGVVAREWSVLVEQQVILRWPAEACLDRQCAVWREDVKLFYRCWMERTGWVEAAEAWLLNIAHLCKTCALSA